MFLVFKEMMLNIKIPVGVMENSIGIITQKLKQENKGGQFAVRNNDITRKNNKEQCLNNKSFRTRKKMQETNYQ